MNFQDLMAKMRELDQPMPEASEPVVPEASVEECGETMGMTPPGPSEPPHTPPSMSINVNAQGLDDIAELMQLLTKVNPDMQKPEAPELTINSPGMPGMSGGAPELPPLKMLPDLDAEEPEGDDVSKAQGDLDNDGDHDMDDHDMEKDSQDDEEKKDEWANTPAGENPDPELKSTDYMVNKLAGGMNRPKGQHKHSYRAGDNPMAMPEGDLRAAIRAELLQRLAEAKGAK